MIFFFCPTFALCSWLEFKPGISHTIAYRETLAANAGELERNSEEIDQLKEGLASANAMVNAHASSLDGLLHDYEEEKGLREALEIVSWNAIYFIVVLGNFKI